MLEKFFHSNVKHITDLKSFSNLSQNIYGTNVQWICDHERETTKENHNWHYKINEYGFRGNFNNINDLNVKKIGFFGCSITFGQGLEEEFTFPSLVQESFKNEFYCYNFATIGGSQMRIARILAAVTNVVNLKYAVILLPNMFRFMFYVQQAEENYSNFIELIPTLDGNRYPIKDSSLSFKNLFRYFDQDNLTLMSIDYITWMHNRCLSKNIIPLFSSWDEETYKLLKQIIPSDNLINLFEFDGKSNLPNYLARDGSHPGKIPNENFSHIIIRKIEEFIERS